MLKDVETMGFDIKLGVIRIQYDKQDKATLYIAGKEIMFGMKLKELRGLMKQIREDMYCLDGEFAYGTGAVKLDAMLDDEERREAEDAKNMKEEEDGECPMD